jgi:hypothetical protein
MGKRIRYVSTLWALLLTGALLAADVIAEEGTAWITAEGSGAMDRGKEEARKLALEDALRQARSQVIGSSITAESLAVNLKLSGGIAAAIPYLRVIDTTILEEGMMNTIAAGNSASVKTYRVLVKAGIIEDRTGADPSFKLESSLNRLSFVDGDEMKITIKATKDCYAAVFIIMEDGKVLRLLPNRLKNTFFLKAGETFSFPDEADKHKGIKLVVHMLDNKVGNESIYILAIKQPFSNSMARFQEGIYGVYDGNTAFMNDLVQEIVGIPLQDRAEKFLQYQIRKDKGGSQ